MKHLSIYEDYDTERSNEFYRKAEEICQLIDSYFRELDAYGLCEHVYQHEDSRTVYIKFQYINKEVVEKLDKFIVDIDIPKWTISSDTMSMMIYNKKEYKQSPYLVKFDVNNILEKLREVSTIKKYNL